MDFVNKSLGNLGLTSKGGRRRKSHRKRRYRGGASHPTPAQFGSTAASVGGRRSRKSRKSRKSRRRR